MPLVSVHTAVWCGFAVFCTSAYTIAGLILDLRPANERWCYFVMMSFIGWAQALNQPCILSWICCKHAITCQGSVSLQRRDNVTSLLANGSAAFIWKLHCHWLKGLWQRHVAVVIQGPQYTLLCCGRAVNMPSCTFLYYTVLITSS